MLGEFGEHLLVDRTLERHDIRDHLDRSITLTAGTDIPSPAEFQVLIAGVPDVGHLQASPALTTVIIPWAGLSTKAREALLQFPHLAVHNIHHADIPTAEMAMALLLAAAKDLGMHKSTLFRKIRSLRIQIPPSKKRSVQS